MAEVIVISEILKPPIQTFHELWDLLSEEDDLPDTSIEYIISVPSDKGNSMKTNLKNHVGMLQTSVDMLPTSAAVAEVLNPATLLNSGGLVNIDKIELVKKTNNRHVLRLYMTTITLDL